MYNSSGTSVSSLTFDSEVSTALNAATDLTFSYTLFKMPRSTNSACGNFTIAVTTSTGNAIESGTGGSITAATANTLASFQITAVPTFLTNGQTANYTISSTPNSNTPLVSGDRYYITFPSEIDITSATCTTLTCTRNSGDLVVTVSSNNLSPVSFTVEDLVVQSSTQPITTTVTVSVATSSGKSQVISTHSTTTVPTTSIAGVFTNVSLSQSSNTDSAAGVQYAFTLTTTNVLAAGSVILIANTPNLGFTFDSSLGCGTASGKFDTCTQESGANGVQIGVNTPIAASESFTIIIGNYTNPSRPTSDSFTVTSYVSNSRTYKVDEISAGLVPSLECDFPCKTCSTSSRTTCTSCFTDDSSITEKYFVEDSNTCVSS